MNILSNRCCNRDGKSHRFCNMHIKDLDYCTNMMNQSILYPIQRPYSDTDFITGVKYYYRWSKIFSVQHMCNIIVDKKNCIILIRKNLLLPN